MADSNFAATPYPTYNLGDTGDDGRVQSAVLTAATAASIERNTDARFQALDSREIQRDVLAGTKDAQITALECRAALLAEIKDHERRSVERDNAVQKELALIRAEHAAQNVASMARELAKVEADARAATANSLLEKILAKLP